MRGYSRFSQGLALGAALSAAGFFLVSGSLKLKDFNSRTTAQILGRAHQQLAQDYVEPIDPQSLMHQGVAGMISSLEDPYSSFVGPDKMKIMEEEAEGELIGIGAIVAAGGTIRYPLGGSPAEDAGLRPGDTIRTVDGESVLGIPTRDLLDKVKGPQGTTVNLSVLREDGTLFETEIVRKSILTGTISKINLLDAEKGIGSLHLRSFARSTPEELDRALAHLERKGILRGLILDLRFNTGGLLESTIAVASRFISDGPICSLLGRQGILTERRANPDYTSHPEIPLVVILNNRSASGSEILAGALRDRGAAVLVGEPSFGKGVYQKVQKYPNGEFSIKFTAGYYVTPSGRKLEGHMKDEEVGGLIPDIPVVPINPQHIKEWLYWDAPPSKWREDVARLFPNYIRQAPEDLAIATSLKILQKTIVNNDG